MTTTCPAATLPPTIPTSLAPAAAPPAARRIHPAGFYLLASITITFLMGSSAPTPLYPVYQAMWGFSSATVTEVFASYVLVLLAALLVFGRLSDHIGRKPVILAAVAMQVVAMAVFAGAHGVAALYAGRILQGIATGAAIAAVGAGMLDLDRARGTIANAIAPAIGTALGGFVSGLLVHYLPAPTHLVYGVLAAIYLLQGLGIALLPEPGQRRAGAWASLKPQLATPEAARAPLRMAAPILVAGWALAGFYASLGPGLIHRVFGFDASLGGGFALFLLAGSAGVTVLALKDLQPLRLMRIGAAALATGMAGVLWALSAQQPGSFLLAAILAGIGFGAGFQGGVRSVIATASPAQRAGVLSVVFVVAYVAMGLPAVIAGLVAAATGNLVGTGLGFGAFVLALAMLALRATTVSTPDAGPRVLE
jgi:MFS family permease